ncbi:AraC family transcriptional regulator [Octadecabacter sp. G9-8]|uniref:AraC family transcriptional regulator n=1 Tax=Octadecabacter dasysiphoniae TaxID=2909341 RepID=A0ABS9CRZ4_9RHOB|nr:AraC family transcriptional regulator [Octadecabacter dasysiphoniae]MCF2869512.1 AraC family transcriptional regulator [Octadecabacter dasysiphoniae]
MSIIEPEIEVLEANAHSVRYLEHGWPDPLCRWHSHKECELHLILDTQGKAFVGDYIGDFGPKSLFLTGPNLPHNWITDEFWDGPVTHRDMVIQFDQDRIIKLASAFGEFSDVSRLIERSRSGLEFFDFDFDWVRNKFVQVRDLSGTYQMLAFIELLTYVTGIPSAKELSLVKMQQNVGDTRHARIAIVIDYIVEHFAENLKVETAAELSGMSPQTFSRNFQAVTGRRFVEFVNRVRIGEACGMLYATELQITEICHKAGFKNLANFNRHFLKVKSMTPSEYRDIARKDLVPQLEAAQ